MKKLFALLIAVTMMCTIAFAADVEYPSYNWVCAMTVNENTINYMLVEKFAQLIEERSSGKIHIDLYPGGQLGNDSEFIEGVFAGSIDFGTTMSSGLVDYIPQYALFDLPNLFDNIGHMRALLKSDFMGEFNQFNKKGGINMLAYSDAGFRQLTSNKPVRKLADLAGQKIRVMTNKYHIAYWNSIGAAATPMQFTELFMGLQQGTVDGQENPYMNIVGNNLQEVQKYIIETNHHGHIIVFFINNALYESLDANTKALVDQCAADARDYANGLADESIASYKDTCIKAGCEIIELPAEEIATIREKASIVYDMVREDLGAELVDKLMNAINAAR